MPTVTVSPKFQVVIPKEVRERLSLKPGQKLFMFVIDSEIRLGPPRSIRELRGMAKGIRWEEGDRDRRDRF
jgi:AbrB family looped-hinge helix DNA binding protein